MTPEQAAPAPDEPLPQAEAGAPEAGAPVQAEEAPVDVEAVTFTDLITDAVLSATLNGPQIANNTVVSLGDTLSLRYTFTANVTACADILQGIDPVTITNGTAYYVPFPAGLEWVSTATNGWLSDLNAK